MTRPRGWLLIDVDPLMPFASALGARTSVKLKKSNSIFSWLVIFGHVLKLIVTALGGPCHLVRT